MAAFVAVFALSLGAVAARPQHEKHDQKKAKPPADYALIYGTVWTAHDEPAYGVVVKIRRADEKKARWEQMSDHSGEFAQRVPTGKHDYIITAEVKTPKGKPKPQTVAHVEFDERVDISLHLTE